MADLPEFERALAALEDWTGLLRELGRDGNNPTETELILGCRDAARFLSDDAMRVLRAMREDFENCARRSDAQEKLLTAYRVGRPPSEATFGVLEKFSREWLDAARKRWGVR